MQTYYVMLSMESPFHFFLENMTWVHVDALYVDVLIGITVEALQVLQSPILGS